MAAFAEFGPFREDFSALTMLPLYGDAHAIGVVLSEEDNEKLDYMNEPLFASRSSEKATYASWIPYFDSKKERIVVTLSRLCWPTGCLGSSFPVPLKMDQLVCLSFSNLIGKRKRLEFALLYLDSLLDRLGECVSNTVLSVGRYDVVTHE